MLEAESSQGTGRDASRSRSASRSQLERKADDASSRNSGPSAMPQRTRIQSFEEILAAVRSGAMPSVMPARAGSALRPPGGGGFTLPARSLYDSGYRGQSFGPSGEDCPQARPEMLERAREEARIAEEQGKGMRIHDVRMEGEDEDEDDTEQEDILMGLALKKGPAANGPPGLPTGIVVIEQKFVDFLLGPAGQSLAAINHAAGVNVILDQTHKFSGYSHAKIYGSEEKVKDAKLAIDFKLSQWLPLQDRRRGLAGAPASAPAPLQGSESGLWSRQSARGTSPVKEIEDSSAVKVTGGLL
eukprot:s29_g10.t1